MIQDKKFYKKVIVRLQPVLECINSEKQELLNLKKPIEKKDTSYYNRIYSAIAMECTLSRKQVNYMEAMNYFSNEENCSFEWKKIMELNFFINCEKGIEYVFGKKLICMILGISIEVYQQLMNSGSGFSALFIRNLEEWLVSIRQEAAETYSRNFNAVDSTLKTKGEFGGFNVEMHKENKVLSSGKIFDAKTASVDEIQNHLVNLIGMAQTNAIDVEAKEIEEGENKNE